MSELNYPYPLHTTETQGIRHSAVLSGILSPELVIFSGRDNTKIPKHPAMPFSLKSNKRFLAVMIVVISVVAYWLFWPWPFAELRGQLAARIDLWSGSYKVLAIGLPSPWRAEYVRLLQERYGIRVQKMADCIVSESLVSYVRNYNELSASAANHRVGRDPFRECDEDARKAWEQQRREKGLAPIAAMHFTGGQ